MLFIGIDLGTSATKLLLMSEDGEIKNVVSKEYPVSYPHPGWSEQDPADWWEAVRTGVPELIDGFDASEVRGIGCGGQMHGLVALDESFEVIRPAILWNDGRSERQVRYLNDTIGREKVSSWTANIAFAGFTAPKILWMRENEPELFSRIAHVMLPKDYVNFRLTGNLTTDFSDASGMLLLDVEHRRWSPQMLELCGITEEQLPRLLESYEVAGTLKPEVARELNLREDVVVAAGAGDNAAAAVGTGAVGEGRCNISLGTSGTIFITSERFRRDQANALHAFDHADGGYHLMGCILSAASCNRWWTEDIMGTTDYDGLQEGISLADTSTSLTYFLPYLMGERSPHNNPAARGAFVGMRLDTPRSEMTRAVLEGVAFAFKDCLEIARDQGIKVASSTVCGGGARSRLWVEMLATILDLDLEIPQTEQGPGLGGAMLAAVACGAYPSVADCVRAIIRVRDVVRPRSELVDAYARRYEVWRGLYPALKDSFAKMEA
jgi:xylulokinase